MKKMLVIKSCKECLFYYVTSFNQKCTCIHNSREGFTELDDCETIHPDCPLQDYEEGIHEDLHAEIKE